MLAAAQQLSPFDRQRLDKHLATCESCSDFYQDMASLAGVLATTEPALGATARGAKTLTIMPPIAASELGTDDQAVPLSGGNRIQSRNRLPLIAASIACFVCGLGSAHLFPTRSKEMPTSSAITKPAAPALAAPVTQRSASSSGSAATAVVVDKDEGLKADLNRLQMQYKAIQAELTGLRQQDQESARTNQDREADLSKLRLENSTQLALISKIQLQLDQARSIHAQDTKLIALRDDQVRQLTTSVVANSSETSETRKLNEASKLMGQRNLHVVDVYDNNTKGQRTPAFGRVFYSEGGPMMFVAFDLPDHGPSDKTTYHAWGQMEGSSKKPLQLGTFTQDDAASQRWVMRVSDTRLLKQVDAVFITADRGTDVQAPNGLPLLYAYLRQVPNHP
jgi:hypothetical protein